MKNNLIAESSITINASLKDVWDGLTNPTLIKKYMMGATVHSDWKKGSKISWEGEVKGKSFKDKGEILQIETGKKLKYSHFSPLSGEIDKPENYHSGSIELKGNDDQTIVSLSQDKNGKEKEESQKNWGMMLKGLKKTVEEKSK